MPSLRDNNITGLEFIAFLGGTERTSITSKEELKCIYDQEFRNRFNKCRISNGQVLFRTKDRVTYGDQWRQPRKKKDSGSLPPAVNGTPQEQPVGTPPVQVPVKKQLAKDILQDLQKNRSHYTADKEGIVITSDHETKDGKIRFRAVPSNSAHMVRVYIKNQGPDPVQFTLYTSLHRFRYFTLVDEEKVTRNQPLLLIPGDSYEIQVHCRVPYVGYFPITIAFEFKHCSPADARPFYIVRTLEMLVSSYLEAELGPKSPYRPYQREISKAVEITVDEGVPPESNGARRLKVVLNLEKYNYPKYLKALARVGLEDSDSFYPSTREHCGPMKALLDSQLNFENYERRFQLLLHLEEIQMEVDIRKYDMTEQPMRTNLQDKRLLILRVPGVAENRPSVLRGDHLLVSISGEKVEPITKYKGYVYKVELDQVKLGFSRMLLNKFIEKMKFDVTFTFNRFPLMLQHRAVQLAVRNRLGHVLFPSQCTAPEKALPELRLYDSSLEKNPEQFMAVRCIVAGVSKPAPFLVFGPPGTGKTVTIVEAIKQVHKCYSESFVLACAPSNSASDLLCERLLTHVDHHKIYRMYASSRDPATVPVALQVCSNFDHSQDCFVYPSKEELMNFKIIITTVVTAGWLVSGGIPKGHFTHIFVDEAGHTVEPECVIGMAGLLDGDSGQLVLAGDPKQLGPTLRSPMAIQHGLGMSLLERLMTTNPLYQKHPKTGKYNRRFVTKLLRNYRSHPAILKIPNEMFYDGELQVFADEMLRNSYCSWEHLPKKGFPVIFHGVLGKDEREGNSPSFFNVDEIHVLVSYLKNLLQTQGKKGLGTLSPKDIGIISPYRKQVEKIRKAIHSVDPDLKKLDNVKELKVGSVEEFQGQERKVIIVSTVRSDQSYVKMDEDFSLGFLKNEKRFNVAITRAKALLIVVGNPIILFKDPSWAKFICYCSDEGGYDGHVIEEEEADLVDRLADLNLSAEPPVAPDASLVQQQLEPEWRSDL
ncbi:putative helicase mov-10-B.1 isoform X2 [Amia ocellicauda]|uniref:putative helicase mov-10-B.1 isoform X2 n=1 Tax=Amia ocellicauda TaxID=2972642 RepID=UPI0034647A9A